MLGAVFIALHQPGDKGRGSFQQGRVGGRPDQAAFREGLPQMMGWRKEFRIAKGFQRTHAQDNLLSSLFGGLDLPIQLPRLEDAGLRFDVAPVSPQPDQLERISQQRLQGGAPIQAKGCRLERAKADSQPGIAAGCNRQALPGVGQGLGCRLEPEFENAHLILPRIKNSKNPFRSGRRGQKAGTRLR